jgi:hypothetical protein
MVTEEDAEKANDFIRDNAENLGKAKAVRVYLEDFRKSKKALLFAKKSGTVAERENYAYAHAEYQDLIMGLKEAVQAEEALRWKMKAAELKIDLFRTQESSRRGGF